LLGGVHGRKKAGLLPNGDSSRETILPHLRGEPSEEETFSGKKEPGARSLVWRPRKTILFSRTLEERSKKTHGRAVMEPRRREQSGRKGRGVSVLKKKIL